MKTYDACLLLATGQCFFGFSLGIKKDVCAELCFTTASVGYQLTITDPSFADQIIVFTSPHIGNIGINSCDNESKKAFCSAVVFRENIVESGHFLQQEGLHQFLVKNNISGICGVDTRAVTQVIATFGSQNAVITHGSFDIDSKDLNSKISVIPKKVELRDLTQKVTGFANNKHRLGVKKVALVDFGAKDGIAKNLSKYFDVEVVKAVPGFAQKILFQDASGIVFSNGPGDPMKTFGLLKTDLEKIVSSNIPILGICLGHQILAIAFGAKTTKMEVGHRGINHPVLNLETGKVEITSQNHGFVVDQDSLDSNIKVTHRSLFDGSIEGIAISNKRIFSVQYHPEGSPGPSDSEYIFSSFADEVNS
jgi:carbamoyl-phosphate synthase small subunit